MGPKPSTSPKSGKAAEPSGANEDKDDKAAKLRERVRERLKAQKASAAGGDKANADRKRGREVPAEDTADTDAKRRKTETQVGPSGTSSNQNQADTSQFTDSTTALRRARVEEWRKQRKNVPSLNADTADPNENESHDTVGWSLEDESDDDAPATGPVDDDDEDPLEAFMAANDSVMDAERAAAKQSLVDKDQVATQKKQEKHAKALEAEMQAQFAVAASLAARAARAATATSSAPRDDESLNVADPKTTTPPGADIDPLDAFMAENNAKADQMVAEVKAKEEKLKGIAASVKPQSFASVAGGVVLKPTGGFLKGLTVKKKQPIAIKLGGVGTTKRKQASVPIVRRFFDADSDSGDDSDSSDNNSGNYPDSSSDSDAAWTKKQTSKLSKAEKLGVTDHSVMEYSPFRKNFYIESFEIARMSEDEVTELRTSLEGVRCKGKNVPRPIKTWAQCGLSNRVSELIRRSGFDKPTPIQSQALPVIMSGRDCVGVAKTGSGKTLAYILPMLRHCKDQPALKNGDGPIAMLIGPTRELVTQIGKDCKKFGRAGGLVSVSVYGGSGVAQQIGELKRGCEIVVCTPGRMIDVLTTSGGRVTNLRRVTYLVLDEADRMFDMGFEPQITRITNNLRPDRQTVLFSATFPKAMEALARAALTDPVEIQVGGRSVVNSDIEQIVEMRDEADRFLRLLELLGEWYERGKSIVFVSSQEKCDKIFRDLLRSGYPCLSLHGGKEQSDRECTVSDFKTDVCNILVATSVAARGLDVKDLRLVINYDTPNHLEDYVHRVGRTGRAGNKGTAVTFISEEEEKFAPDLCKAMIDAKQVVPTDLKEMAERYNAKKKQGLVKDKKQGGFGGTGFSFSKEEMEREKRAKKQQAKAGGIEIEDDSDDDENENETFDDDGEPIFQTTGRGGFAAAAAAETKRKEALGTFATGAAGVQKATLASGGTASEQGAVGAASAQPPNKSQTPPLPTSALAVQGAGGGPNEGALTLGGATTGAARAAAFAAALAAQHAAGTGRGASGSGAQGAPRFESELEINDFPQKARWNVTHKDSLSMISDFTGAVITTRGQYLPPGKPLPIGERKLYLLIEGPTERSVAGAKGKIKEIIENAIAKESLPGGAGTTGKYKI
tara:strand:+ start:29058 stop:32429 length:3372 start_codon:yes stop_codon:yes gene_type:complete